MKNARLLYLAALLGAVIFCIANGRWLSWYLLLTVLAAPWLSLLVSLPAMRSTSVELSVPPRLSMGSTASVHAAIRSKGLHLPVRIELGLFLPLTGETRTVTPGIALPTAHCGGLVLTPKKMACYDLLGLWKRSLPQFTPLRVYVMPKAVQHSMPTHLAQYLSFAWRPKAGGGYSEQHEMREYHPGDNLNQIHWKLSAKTGDLIIREPLEPLHNRVLLTMDLRGTPDQLDYKLGQLRWMGEYLLQESMKYSVLVLTGDGLLERGVTTPSELQACLEALLCAPCAAEGTVLNHQAPAAWRCHIGGVPDEA